MSNQELLNTAIAAASAAGQHAMANLGRRREADAFGRHDVKLRLDRECQDVAANIIRTAHPDHDLLGEESLAETHGERLRWIIDPIDGTVNFYYGLPWWCCSVAVQSGEQTIAGAVYAPELGRLYQAVCDGPALCNGVDLQVSQAADMASAMIVTGVSQKLDEVPGTLDWFREAALQSRKLRMLGSAALDLCQVAAGVADGYFEASIYLWDIAAAALIVERAGGQVEILRHFEGHRMQVLAGNGCCNDELRTLVNACMHKP